MDQDSKPYIILPLAFFLELRGLKNASSSFLRRFEYNEKQYRSFYNKPVTSKRHQKTLENFRRF